MSVLSNQVGELRGYALSVRSVALRTTSLCHEARRDLLESAVCMEQAADTITSLKDKLQGVMGTRYNELFGTPERAADYFATQCMGGDAHTCEMCPLEDCNGTLHTSPHPVIRVVLLEWLRGDA